MSTYLTIIKLLLITFGTAAVVAICTAIVVMIVVFFVGAAEEGKYHGK